MELSGWNKDYLAFFRLLSYTVRANTKITTAKIVVILCYIKYKKYIHIKNLNFYIEINTQ